MANALLLTDMEYCQQEYMLYPNSVSGLICALFWPCLFRLVFEVLPRRIHLHLPDARLLLEGQGDEATRTTAAAAAGLGKGDRKAWWKRSRRKGFRTGESTAFRPSAVSGS